MTNGYRPKGPPLDTSRPPQGGSGVPPKRGCACTPNILCQYHYAELQHRRRQEDAELELNRLRQMLEEAIKP